MLAHRGWWESAAEKNGMPALKRALEAGFGIETDVRDAGGDLVIAHDPPRGGEATVRDFLAAYRASGSTAPLALNIKSDGLQVLLRRLLDEFAIDRAVVFDMSIPDTLGWRRAAVPFLTRQSEFEPSPALYQDAAGVWIDCFESSWYDADVIRGHLDAGKIVAVVSAELHGRRPEETWQRLATMALADDPRLWLCTDLPAEAARLAARSWLP